MTNGTPCWSVLMLGSPAWSLSASSRFALNVVADVVGVFFGGFGGFVGLAWGDATAGNDLFRAGQADARNPGYLSYYIWSEHFGRYATASFDRWEPWRRRVLRRW